jgi:hypothetical protein
MKKFGFAFIIVSYCANANAYIDPGTGLIAIQGLLALVGGLLMFLKNPVKTIKSLFSHFNKKKR